MNKLISLLIFLFLFCCNCVRGEGGNEGVLIVGADLVSEKGKVIYSDFHENIKNVRLDYYGVHDVGFLVILNQSISVLLKDEKIENSSKPISLRFRCSDGGIREFTLRESSTKQQMIMLRGISSDLNSKLSSFFEKIERKKMKKD